MPMARDNIAGRLRTRHYPPVPPEELNLANLIASLNVASIGRPEKRATKDANRTYLAFTRRPRSRRRQAYLAQQIQQCFEIGQVPQNVNVDTLGWEVLSTLNPAERTAPQLATFLLGRLETFQETLAVYGTYQTLRGSDNPVADLITGRLEALAKSDEDRRAIPR